MPLINKLVLGTVQFGLPYGINNKTGQPKLSESLEILKEAKRNGIEWLDTAEAY
jgi:aryl-alcohol dehydrogenase-like predicted oxidoreductase